MTPESSRLDGNAAAGRLSDVVVFDTTAAQTRCGACGMTAPLGAYHVYADAPGMVVRCPTCEAMAMRIAQTPGHTWLDMSGVAALDVRPERDCRGATHGTGIAIRPNWEPRRWRLSLIHI